MAKYDWKQLEKEYILGEDKSISEFLKNKGIKDNAYIRRTTKGWKEKKSQNSQIKVIKTIEKVTEKETEREAQQIVNIKTIANDLALKVIEAQKELNMHIAKSTKKTKTVKYDYKCNKPSKETIEENEEIKSYMSIIDRKGLKELASALKDLNDILNNRIGNENNNSQSLADTIQKAYESKVGDN